ncbi:Os04g0461050, partial [Oryza sativa Japonica Group]
VGGVDVAPVLVLARLVVRLHGLHGGARGRRGGGAVRLQHGGEHRALREAQRGRRRVEAVSRRRRRRRRGGCREVRRARGRGGRERAQLGLPSQARLRLEPRALPLRRVAPAPATSERGLCVTGSIPILASRFFRCVFQ